MRLSSICGLHGDCTEHIYIYILYLIHWNGGLFSGQWYAGPYLNWQVGCIGVYVWVCRVGLWPPPLPPSPAHTPATATIKYIYPHPAPLLLTKTRMAGGGGMGITGKEFKEVLGKTVSWTTAGIFLFLATGQTLPFLLRSALWIERQLLLSMFLNNIHFNMLWESDVACGYPVVGAISPALFRPLVPISFRWSIFHAPCKIAYLGDRATRRLIISLPLYLVAPSTQVAAAWALKCIHWQ